MQNLQMNDFGKLLKQKREQAGLSPEELSNQLGRKLRKAPHATTIYRWEAGTNRPGPNSRETLLTITREVQMSVQETSEFLKAAGQDELGAQQADIETIKEIDIPGYRKVQLLVTLGWNPTEIAEGLGLWGIQTVHDQLQIANAEDQIRELQEVGVHGLRKMHLQRMYDQVQKIRDCLPDADMKRGKLEMGMINSGFLLVSDYDWRLDPSHWLKLVTPDFTMRHAWGPDFPIAVKHMRGSPFWKHMGQLRTAVRHLVDRYDNLADGLKQTNERFGKSWEELAIRGKYQLDVSRTPLTPEMKPPYYKPSYNDTYCKQVMSEFYSLDSDLRQKQFELDQLAERLWDDLRPDNIEPIIKNGHCEKCP